tara:strand:+ start:52 stop:324 length:273 start_codon:yes stop_codon:yes gene_type:complete
MLEIPAGDHRIRLTAGRSAQQHGHCQRHHHPSGDALKPRTARRLPATRGLAVVARAAVARAAVASEIQVTAARIADATALTRSYHCVTLD